MNSFKPGDTIICTKPFINPETNSVVEVGTITTLSNEFEVKSLSNPECWESLSYPETQKSVKQTPFNPSINIGDYVITSKGNIGVIVEPACIKIEMRVTANEPSDTWICLQKYSLYQSDEAEYCLVRLSKEYPSRILKKTHMPNMVKIGKKIYPIWSNKLKKLRKLTIGIGTPDNKQFVTLPIEDAKKLIDIYKRNKIRFFFK